jgi:hypothetical protein
MRKWQRLCLAFASALIAAPSCAHSSESMRSLPDVPPIVLAQAGSTGGTIGKQDKSLSGGEETPPPHRNTPSAKPAPAPISLPPTIHLNEHNATWGEFSATLKRTDSNNYEAVWKDHALISRMTVTIGQESMTIERRDLSGGINLCHGHYTGTRVPGTSKASGEDTVACTLGGATSTWDASW